MNCLESLEVDSSIVNMKCESGLIVFRGVMYKKPLQSVTETQSETLEYDLSWFPTVAAVTWQYSIVNLKSVSCLFVVHGMIYKNLLQSVIGKQSDTMEMICLGTLTLQQLVDSSVGNMKSESGLVFVRGMMYKTPLQSVTDIVRDHGIWYVWVHCHCSS